MDLLLGDFKASFLVIGVGPSPTRARNAEQQSRDLAALINLAMTYGLQTQIVTGSYNNKREQALYVNVLGVADGAIALLNHARRNLRQESVLVLGPNGFAEGPAAIREAGLIYLDNVGAQPSALGEWHEIAPSNAHLFPGWTQFPITGKFYATSN